MRPFVDVPRSSQQVAFLPFSMDNRLRTSADAHVQGGDVLGRIHLVLDDGQQGQSRLADVGRDLTTRGLWEALARFEGDYEGSSFPVEGWDLYRYCPWFLLSCVLLPWAVAQYDAVLTPTVGSTRPQLTHLHPRRCRWWTGRAAGADRRQPTEARKLNGRAH